MGKRFLFCSGLLGALLICTGLAHAGTTGKISGKVTEVTGDPLPGANVVIDIDGVKRAGITDEKGEYFIINIPPGTYDIETVMMGYSKSVHQGVVINVDHTTTVNFQMQEEALQLGEMIVVAERPPVEHDKTESKSVITAEEIESLPIVREMSDFVELQAGVTPDEEESVRGGNFWETAYMVDGVRVVNNDARAGFTRFQGVNTSAVQELTVLSGGMNAEYGNAGAVVSVVTKEGGQKYTGRGEYRITPPGQKHWGANVYEAPVHRGRMQWGNSEWENLQAWFPGTDGILGHSNETGEITDAEFAADDVQRKVHVRQDYTGVWGGRGEAMLGGPIVRKMGFTLTSSMNRNPSSLPAPTATSLFNNRTNLKLTYRPSGNVKFNYGSLFNQRSRYNAGVIRRIEQGSRKNMNSSGRNLFVPSEYSGAGKLRTRDFMNYASLTHTLSARTFYEIRVSYSRTTEVNTELPVNTDQPYVEPGIGNESGWFYIGRPVVNWTDSERDRLQIKLDYSSQVTKGHFIKTGFDMLFFDNWGFSRNKNDFRGLIDRYYSQFNNPRVGVMPRQYSIYFQDKMEFEGIVVNVGLRGLRWSPNTEMPQAAYFLSLYKYHDPTKIENIPTYRPPAIHVLSPRVGVSHPITESSAMHFTFGKFEQIEQFWWIFSHSYRTEEAFLDLNQNGRIDESELYNTQDVVDAGQWGWPLLRPLVTTSFEVGADWNFITDYTAGLTAYYKQQVNRRSGGSYRHQSQGLQHQRLVNSSGQTNNRDTRGFELSLKKKFNHMTAFTIAYNVQWVENGNSGVRGHHYVNPDRLATKNPSNFGNYAGYIDNNGNFLSHYWYEWTADSNGDGDFTGVDGVDGPGIVNGDDTGEEFPRPMDGITRFQRGQAFGSQARNQLEQVEDGVGRNNWSLDQENSLLNWDGKGASTWLQRNNQSQEFRPANLNRTNFGTVTFMFSSPKAFGPRFVGFRPFENLRLNVVYRLFTGRRFFYSPPEKGGEGFFNGPIHTRTDINFEKTFNLNRRASMTIFFESFNLFNQKDPHISYRVDNQLVEVGAEYVEWGVIYTPLPDNPEYIAYGDVGDYLRFQDSPREFHFGLRMKF